MQATLLTLAIAVILALLAALFGPYFVDWTAHRATFEQQASAVVGLPVKVSGRMDVRLLPSPTLVLSGVEIGNPGDPQAVKAKALGIEFALPPLLSGKLRAVELRLIAPEMRVSLNERGRAIVPNALGGVRTEALSIDKLVVEDASLELSDAASGSRVALSKLWFNGEVRALPGPIRGEGAFVMDGALYGYRVATARPEANGSRIRLTIDPSDRPVYAEAEGLLTANDGTPRFEGQATIARRAVAKGDAASPWRISARVKANAANALFEQVEYQYGPDDRALKLTGTAEAKFGARPRLDAVLSARTLDADKLLASGGKTFTPREALAALVTAVERIIGPPIPTQVGFGIDALTLGGASLQNIRGDVEFAAGAIALSGLELRAPGFTQVQASGRLEKSGGQLRFVGPVDVSAGDPRALADWLEGKAAATALPARPVHVRGDLTLGHDKVAIDRLQAEFDRKAFSGNLAYAFARPGEPSRFEAVVRADELDLDGILDAAGSVGTLADLRPEELAFSLSLGRLRVGGVDADSADVRLSLGAGQLDIQRLAIADLAGLALDGMGRVDLKEQRGTVSFNLAMRDPKGLSAMATRAPPALADLLQRAAQAAAPAKLAGTITLEPGRGGDSRAILAVEGPLGAIQFKLKGALSGRWPDLRHGEIALDGSLETGDVNALLRLAAADRAFSTPRQPGTYTLSLNGKLDGDMRLDTRLVSAALDARASGSIRPFAADRRDADVEIAIGKSDFVLPGADVRKTVPVAFKSRLVTDAAGARLDDMSAVIAGSAMRGRLALTYGEMPVIDGEVRTDTVDLGAVLAAVTGSGGAASSKDAPRWSETPFALPALPPLSGQIVVSAARAALSPALQAARFRTTLRFANLNVKADAIEAELLGGHLAGDIDAQRSPDGVSLRGRVGIADADATQLLFGDGPAPLTGRAALKLQFEGMGRSPRALIGSLNGGGTLVLANARFASLDPKVFAAAMLSADQGLPIDAPRVREVAGRALDQGVLKVANAEAALTIAAGVIRIDRFEARAEAADLAISGSYNLADAKLDTRLLLSGAAAGSAVAPEIAVLLRGPASAPERVLDVSALTGWLALRSVDRQTKKIEAIEQGRPLDAALQPKPEAAPRVEPPRTEPPRIVSPRAEPSVPRRAPLATPEAARPLGPVVRPAPQIDPRRATPAPRIPIQRAEPQRPGGGNPFPQPLGTPAPLVRQPLPRVQPVF